MLRCGGKTVEGGSVQGNGAAGIRHSMPAKDAPEPHDAGHHKGHLTALSQNLGGAQVFLGHD